MTRSSTCARTLTCWILAIVVGMWLWTICYPAWSQDEGPADAPAGEERQGLVSRYVNEIKEKWQATGEQWEENWDVTNRFQEVSLPGSTGGTFTLTFEGETTEPVDWNAEASSVKDSLESLTTIAAGDLTVKKIADGNWKVEFGGSHAGGEVPLLTGDGSSLTGTAMVEIPDRSQRGPADKIQGSINLIFGFVVFILEGILFRGVPVGFEQEMPFVLIVLVTGGIFFTFRFGFVNLRLFKHSIDVVRGLYDRPEDEGEVSHFQALTSALSATVGLGNIAGVAAAIAMGGPGSIFWMWLCAFFGMSSKFCSCSLAQIYRRVKEDGTIIGGPMVYLEEGIKDRIPSLAFLGRILGIMFAVFTVFAAFGGGNMFQGNQTFKIMSDEFGIPTSYAWLVGLVMAISVGLVIIGGIRRIGEVTSKMVPTMCGFYIIICLLILAINITSVPAMLLEIVTKAFSVEAGIGGLVGIVLKNGIQRAAFSNEAGLGSAAIAHAAAKTDEPIREGIVAMIGPFIDTIVVCTMTALTILITEAHIDPATGEQYATATNEKGIELTAAAFSSLGAWAPKVLCVAVIVFAYSTMISWSYYGEKAIEYLFGQRAIVWYRVVFVIMVALGPIMSLSAVIGFSDMMLFSMAFPNILGVILLSGLLSVRARDYIGRLRSGEMKVHRK